MNRFKSAVVAVGLVLAGPAYAADLRVIRAPRIVDDVPVADGPVPLITAIPAPSPKILHIPLPDSLFPFFEPPPPPPPSRTIFSARTAYPLPSDRVASPTSPEDAESIHYGYSGRSPQPSLPLGYYPPYSLD